MTFIYENATQDARQNLRIVLRALETALLATMRRVNRGEGLPFSPISLIA